MYRFYVLRFIGDMLHLAGFGALLFKIFTNHSSAGISLKTQELFALVFVSRYLDLFTNFISLYLTVMKTVFIVLTFTIIYLIRFRYWRTYSKNYDTLPHHYLTLALPSLILALIFPKARNFKDIMFTFSLYLEVVAIVPQLWLVKKSGDSIDYLTSNYIFCFVGYRIFYILNWIIRYFKEPNYVRWIIWIPGCVQSILYMDFLYLYFVSLLNFKKISLPK